MSLVYLLRLIFLPLYYNIALGVRWIAQATEVISVSVDILCVLTFMCRLRSIVHDLLHGQPRPPNLKYPVTCRHPTTAKSGKVWGLKRLILLSQEDTSVLLLRMCE